MKLLAQDNREALIILQELAIWRDVRTYMCLISIILESTLQAAAREINLHPVPLLRDELLLAIAKMRVRAF